MPRLPRKTTWQPAWKPSKRKGFAASPVDTELTTRQRRDDDAKTTRRRREDDATSHSRRTRVQPPDRQTINGNPSLRIREKGGLVKHCSSTSEAKQLNVTARFMCISGSGSRSNNPIVRMIKVKSLKAQRPATFLTEGFSPTAACPHHVDHGEDEIQQLLYLWDGDAAFSVAMCEPCRRGGANTEKLARTRSQLPQLPQPPEFSASSTWSEWSKRRGPLESNALPCHGWSGKVLWTVAMTSPRFRKLKEMDKWN